MFGKKAPTQQPTDDFEADDMAQDFAADTEDFAAEDSGETWSDSEDGADVSAQPAKGGSALGKILPFAVIGFVAALGLGYVYINFLAPQATQEQAAGQTVTSETAMATAPEQATPVEPATEAAAAMVTEEAAASVPAIQSEDPTTPMAESLSGSALSEATEAAASPVIDASNEPMTAPADIVTAPIEEQLATSADLPPELAAAAPVDLASSEPVLSPVTEAATTSAEAPASSEVPVTPLASAPIAANPTPAAAEAISPPASIATTASVTAQPAISADNLADMGQRLDVLEHQIEELTKAVDRLSSSSGPVDPALATTVSELQSAVTKLQHDVASSAPAVSTQAQRPVATISTPGASTPMAAPATPRAVAPRVVAPRTSWVLRAAQNGEAWISTTAQGELRHVKVGESVSGLGRVTAVELKNGRWVVTGTQGTVRQ